MLSLAEHAGLGLTAAVFRQGGPEKGLMVYLILSDLETFQFEIRINRTDQSGLNLCTLGRSNQLGYQGANRS